MFKKLLIVCAILAIAGFLVACGGGDDDDEDSGSSSGGGNEVEMYEFRYEPKELTARAGQAVTLELKNEGEQPHSFTITGLVDSQRVEKGQSKSITFTPTQAGSLTFFCTVHGQATMSGTLTVN